MSTRTTKVYSITMPPEMARQAEQLAKRESRTMSELMREAFRRYQVEAAERGLMSDPLRSKRLAQFRSLLAELQREAKEKGLNKKSIREIDAEVAAVRKTRTRKKNSKRPAA